MRQMTTAQSLITRPAFNKLTGRLSCVNVDLGIARTASEDVIAQVVGFKEFILGCTRYICKKTWNNNVKYAKCTT